VSAVDERAPSVVGIAILAVTTTLPVAILLAVGIGFGLPPVVLLPTAIAVSLWAGVTASAREHPGPWRLVVRAVGCTTIGVAVRLLGAVVDGTVAQRTLPDLLLDVRVAGATLVVVVVFVVAHGVGQRAVQLVDAGTLIEEGTATRGLLAMMLSIVLGVLTVQALPTIRTGVVADVAMVLAVVAAFVALADLRSRIRAPGGTRAAVIERPTRTTNRAVALGIALVALVAVALVPLANATSLPDAGPAITWLAERDWFDVGTGTRQPPEGQRFGRPQEREVTPNPAVGERWVPSFDLDVPVWVGLLIAGAVVAAVLRPDRLLQLWRGLRARLAADARDEPDEVGLAPVEPRPGTDRPRARFAGALLGRFRPRPRDPRAAVLHDYGRLERTLERRGYGRGPSETPIGHARRLRADEDLESFVVLVSEARWSDHPFRAEDAATSRRLLQTILGRLAELEPASDAGPQSEHTSDAELT
jgi:hypothetical protein